MGGFKDRMFVRLSVGYLRFVYATSKVIRLGHSQLLDVEEKFIIGFWHGCSFCYYPLLQNRGVTIVTTVNRRGDYVYDIGRMYGYNPVRLPDEHDPDASLQSLRKMLAAAADQHAAYSMDGPLGPYHVPKRFFLTTAYLAKKRILPVSVEVKRKITLTKRWDKYIIPLPFSRITFTFHEPQTAKKNEFDALATKITGMMDGNL